MTTHADKGGPRGGRNRAIVPQQTDHWLGQRSGEIRRIVFPRRQAVVVVGGQPFPNGRSAVIDITSSARGG